jgi:hypothetical protein
MPKLLTEEEYKRTFVGQMADVTATAEPVVDIWSYVEDLVEDGYVHPRVYEHAMVESIYRSEDGQYDHVMLAASVPNVFPIIIVNLRATRLEGHYFLDLNSEYGLEG